MTLPGYRYYALVLSIGNNYYNWCKDTLDPTDWGTGGYYYYFCNEEDAIAFSIRFGVPVKNL